MEDADLLEQDDCYAATFAFADLCAKTDQECFDVLPRDVCAGWVGEDRFQCPLVGTLHACIVPKYGTECKARGFCCPTFKVTGLRGFSHVRLDEILGARWVRGYVENCYIISRWGIPRKLLPEIFINPQTITLSRLCIEQISAYFRRVPVCKLISSQYHEEG